MNQSQMTKIVIKGAVWAVLQSVLVLVADVLHDPWKALILTVIVPLVTLLAKITPQPALVPGSPQLRSSDDSEDAFGSLFRR
jgi:hypothetical protein